MARLLGDVKWQFTALRLAIGAGFGGATDRLRQL